MGLPGKFIQNSVPRHAGLCYRSAVQQQEHTPPNAFSVNSTKTGRLPPRKCPPPQAKVEDRALALPVCNYSVSFTYAARPAFPRRLRTAAQANRPGCRSSVNCSTVMSCPVLSLCPPPSLKPLRIISCQC